jgi:hypothetical protein
LTLRAIPVGVAYAVWSGVGIIRHYIDHPVRPAERKPLKIHWRGFNRVTQKITDVKVEKEEFQLWLLLQNFLSSGMA